MSQSIHLLSNLTTFGAVSATSLTAVGMLSAGRLNIVSDAVIGTSLAVAGPISGSSFSGVGSSLTSLNASNLSSGTVPQARLGISGLRDTTTFLRGDGSWTSAVTAVSVVNANGVSASIANQGTTPTITLTLGAITPNSVTASGNVSGTTLSSSGQATVLALTTTGSSTAQTLTSTGKASIGGTLTVTGATTLSSLDATGSVTAPSFRGAMLATAAFNPVLTTGVYAGVNSANTAIPQFGLVAAAAPTNAKASSFYVDPTNGVLNWALLLDDLTTNASFMTVARSGVTATNITFAGTAITLNGAVTGNSFTTTGASTAQTLTSTGKASIGGTLGVTGATTLTTLSTSGLASLHSLSVATTASITGDLSVSGTVSVNSMSAVSTTVTGSATIAGALSVGGSISGSGSGLTALNASNLSSGTVAVSVLGNTGTRDATTFLRGDNSWATALTGVSVVSANGISASIANSSTTPAITLSLGAITPSSINSTGSVTASVFIPTQTAVPTTGIYAAATGGVAIATNTLERFEVTQTGQINIGGPIALATNPVSASAVDCSKGNYFTKTYSGALTWTFTNVPTGVFYRFVLRLIRGASGTQTWPSTVKWTGGTTPSLTTTTGGSDIFQFMTDDGGASWRAYRLTTTTT